VARSGKSERQGEVGVTAEPGVTFVIPVRNGADWLDRVLRAALDQADGRPFEIIAVEDGSTDESPEILATYQARGLLRIVNGPGRGAAAALNTGIREARHPVVCQIDQDVILEPGWMLRLLDALRDPDVAAAQGYYVTSPDASIWARVMGLDLALRYHRILGRDVDHVCTGNTAYWAEALHAVGLFDECLGYGYDNDISYRLVRAGHRLVIDDRARSVHCWRDNCLTYLVQQYGFGYGRLDLVAKHRRRVGGDDVSGTVMMLHAPLMALALALLAIATMQGVLGTPPTILVLAATVVLSTLVLERTVAGIRAAMEFNDSAGLFFAPVHLVRDVAWALALGMWLTRWLSGGTGRPHDSMRPRTAAGAAGDRRS